MGWIFTIEECALKMDAHAYAHASGVCMFILLSCVSDSSVYCQNASNSR